MSFHRLASLVASAVLIGVVSTPLPGAAVEAILTLDVSPAEPHAGAPFRLTIGGEWLFTKVAQPPEVTIDGSTIQIVQQVYAVPPILPPVEPVAITTEVGPLPEGTYAVSLLVQLVQSSDGPFLIDEWTAVVEPAASITVSRLGSTFGDTFFTGTSPTRVQLVAEVFGVCDYLGEVGLVGERHVSVAVQTAPCTPPLAELQTLTTEIDLTLDTAGRWTIDLLDADGVQLATHGFDVLAFPVTLRNGRFEVEIQFVVGDVVRDALPVGEPSADSALFWFFEPTNWELMLKVLDGCAINGHYWVFGAAQTDLAYAITIRDVLTGTAWTTSHLDGTAAPAITDTTAFATCL